MKKCTACHKTKEPEDFAQDRSRIDGRTHECKECKSLRDRSRTQKRWLLVVQKLGGVCACPGCGEDRPWFLTIDHTNNDGKQDRGRGINPTARYGEILTETCPFEVQLLCFNCNGAKERFGACPGHQPYKKE